MHANINIGTETVKSLNKAPKKLSSIHLTETPTPLF